MTALPRTGISCCRARCFVRKIVARGLSVRADRTTTWAVDRVRLVSSSPKKSQSCRIRRSIGQSAAETKRLQSAVSCHDTPEGLKSFTIAAVAHYRTVVAVRGTERHLQRVGRRKHSGRPTVESSVSSMEAMSVQHPRGLAHLGGISIRVSQAQLRGARGISTQERMKCYRVNATLIKYHRSR